ncbi:Mss4-like protein, partial [Gymnopilus junonius]
VKVKCCCGISTFHIKFDKRRLPSRVSFCHCNSCRHSTGQMAFYGIPIIGPPLIGSTSLRPVNLDTTDLTGYCVSFSSIHYFCPNCSARMFLRKGNGRGVEWLLAGGLLESTEGIIEWKGHVNLADTMDGGLADHIRTVKGKTLNRYAHDEHSEELPVAWRSKELKSREEAMTDDKLHAHCHCGAIRVYITRPNRMSATMQAPYPPLLHPLHSRLSRLHNPKDEKWWLCPSMRMTEAGDLVKMDSHDADFTTPSRSSKYLAGHCVCLQCRLASGFDVQTYAFIPRANIFEEGSNDHHPIEFLVEEYRPQGLQQYCPSPGIYREFCATCGATAFYWQIGHPDVVNVSTGLLDEQDDGVRAEEWLSWVNNRVAFMEEGL